MKTFIFLVFSFLSLTLAMAEERYNPINTPTYSPTGTLFTNQSTAQTGTARDLNFMASCHTWSIQITGTPAATKVQMQGSVDGSYYDTFDTYSVITKTNAIRHVTGKGFTSVRGKIVTFTNGTGVTVKSVHAGGC